METDYNKITVRKKDIVMRFCNACQTKTCHVGKEQASRMANVFVGGQQKQPFSTCIQCFVDVNDVLEWSRWIDPFTGKKIDSPRGYRSSK